MKLKKPQVTFNSQHSVFKIELFDALSRVIFCKIELTPEDFVTALSGLAHVNCAGEVFNLDKIGKKKIHESFVFEMKETIYEEKINKAEELAKKLCPEGWEPVLHFNSQNSFFQKDGKRYARTTIRRWVDIEEGENDGMEG